MKIKPFSVSVLLVSSYLLLTSLTTKYETLTKQNHPNELIVAFENLSDKQLIELDEAIAQIPGVKNFGYCQRQRLYFFTYDEQIYKSEDQVMEAISIHTKKFQPLIKIGTTASQISKNCNNQ